MHDGLGRASRALGSGRGHAFSERDPQRRPRLSDLAATAFQEPDRRPAGRGHEADQRLERLTRRPGRVRTPRWRSRFGLKNSARPSRCCWRGTKGSRTIPRPHTSVNAEPWSASSNSTRSGTPSSRATATPKKPPSGEPNCQRRRPPNLILLPIERLRHPRHSRASELIGQARTRKRAGRPRSRP